jgi:hypothetical protein
MKPPCRPSEPGGCPRPLRAGRMARDFWRAMRGWEPKGRKRPRQSHFFVVQVRGPTFPKPGRRWVKSSSPPAAVGGCPPQRGGVVVDFYLFGGFTL